MRESNRPDNDIRSSGDALREMYRITADHERAFEEKLPALLDLGRSHLGVDVGFLTEISDGTQLIVEARGDNELLQAGQSCPLSKAYCRKTIKHEDALTVQHAAIEGWEDDAAYEAFGLESYIGAKVLVDGEVYGTFCFAGSEPREQPFSEDEETFAELMAEWVGYELFRRRATERIEEQRDQLEEFASVVSHDLRNPLSAASGYLDIAEQSGDPEHFEHCRTALDRMDRLIDDLLALARGGDTIGDTEPIDVAELVAECWSVVTTDEAILDIETDLVIVGDPSRVRQLFENLFRNSIEHGSEDVTVRVGTLEDRRGLYVEDDGVGLPETGHRVFERGFSTGEDGTGFGLAIVDQIAEAHGWTVTATEGRDGGARFEIAGVEVVE